MDLPQPCSYYMVIIITEKLGDTGPVGYVPDKHFPTSMKRKAEQNNYHRLLSNHHTYILELHVTEQLTEGPGEKCSNTIPSIYKSGHQRQTQPYRNLFTNVSLDSITRLAGKSISMFADHFMKLTSKAAASKFYLQCNYLLHKLSYQLLCCCTKEQYKYFQTYCIRCYVKNKLILETFLTSTTTKEFNTLIIQRIYFLLE